MIPPVLGRVSRLVSSSDKVVAVAGCVLVLVVLAAMLGTSIVPDSADIPNIAVRNKPPMSTSYGWLPDLLGTDPLGRDVATQLMIGARVSLVVGVLSVVVSGVIGVVLGLFAGYYKGFVDQIIMRVVDVQMSLPSLLVALLVLYVLGSSMLKVILVLAVTRWMVYARVTRGMVLSVQSEPYIEAAKSTGASDLRVILRHVLPNIRGPILVVSFLEVAIMILSEASLDFLGLGVQPPQTSWGLMLAQGHGYLTSAWWLCAFSGLAILVTTLSLNLIGNWLLARVPSAGTLAGPHSVTVPAS